MIERNRGYLPHLEWTPATYFITFRLAEALPMIVLEKMRTERQAYLEAARMQNRKLTDQEEKRLKYLESRSIQQYLDKGVGECWLGQSRIAETVKESILYFDGTKYTSHAFCIMPNHFHWLLTPIVADISNRLDSALISIMHSIKSFTAQANKILNRKGPFWSREYYDHLVRSSEQFGRILVYISENPIKAGLCKNWRERPWTICSAAISASLEAQDITTSYPASEDAGATNR